MSAIKSRARRVSTRRDANRAPRSREGKVLYPVGWPGARGQADLSSVALHGSEMADAPDEGRPARSDTAATYARVAGLPLHVERCEMLPLTRDTSSGFTKVSTVIRLTGDGHEGQ